jgi:hypothetical protein
MRIVELEADRTYQLKIRMVDFKFAAKIMNKYKDMIKKMFEIDEKSKDLNLDDTEQIFEMFNVLEVIDPEFCIEVLMLSTKHKEETTLKREEAEEVLEIAYENYGFQYVFMKCFEVVSKCLRNDNMSSDTGFQEKTLK